MKRRAAGEGTITQLPSGNWRAQVTLHGRRLSHTEKSQEAARRWVAKMQGQIDQGLTYAGERTTFETFAQGWLENKRGQLRPATYEQYAWISRVYLVPGLGKLKLREITPGRVQAYYDTLARAGKGVRTIQLVHTILHGIMEQAERLGLTAKNPTGAVLVPRSKREEMRIWSEGQVAAFMVFVRGKRNEALYALALATGMRRGELLGLQWKDVDWLAETITVSRQSFGPQGGGYVFQGPKTARGVRAVRIGPGLVERLRGQMAQVDLMRKIAGGRWVENDLVFPSAVGTPQSGDNITHEFQRLVKASGLPQIRLHDCRHTAATIMLSHGIPPVIVAGMLGHSLGVLMERYAHFIPTMQDEAARLMDGVVEVCTGDSWLHTDCTRNENFIGQKVKKGG